MFYVEGIRVLRSTFVEMADAQPFNDAIDIDDPARFIAECLNDGLIEACHGYPVIERRYKKPELQEFCKKFGLPVCGTKAELAERLRIGAQEWYETETGNQKFWQLTALGRETAMRFAEEIGRESGEMEARLTALLLREEVSQAWGLWSDWNTVQPWPTTPENQSPYETGYRPFTLPEFEQVAGEAFMVLPTGDAATFLAGLLMERYMLYEQSNQTQQNRSNGSAYLLSIRECSGVIGLRVNLSPHCNCVFAKAYAGDYRLEDAPLLPPSLCSNEPGCSCWAVAIFDQEATTAGPWKKPIRRHPDAGPPIERTPEPLTEAGIRRLAEVINTMAGTAIQEEGVQEAIANARKRGELGDDNQQGSPFTTDESVRKKPAMPRGFWAWLKSVI